jgi:predicted RNase H-like HicB family nuclease
MDYTLDCEQEEDGRWIAEVSGLPGVMAYGASRDEAILKAEALALRVIAERLEHHEARPSAIHIALPAVA